MISAAAVAAGRVLGMELFPFFAAVLVYVHCVCVCHKAPSLHAAALPAVAAASHGAAAAVWEC